MHSSIHPVPARRHPHQVFLAALLFLSGLLILLGGPRPGSINAVLPGVLVYVWASVMVAGGALVVVAAIVRSPATALYLESIADTPLAVMCFAYAASVVGFAGFRGAVTAAIVLGAGLAFATRARQVSRTIRALHAALRGGPDAMVADPDQYRGVTGRGRHRREGDANPRGADEGSS